MSSNNERPKLNKDTASKLLANVFDACGQEPNTIPLEKLASYSEYRKEKYSFQKVLIVIILIIFLLLPLFFISPKIQVVRITDDTAKTPIYEITVSSWFMPVSSVTASIDSHGVMVYEAGERTYTVEPTLNGILRIKATLLNRQYAVKDIIVNKVDIVSPQLVNQAKIGNKLYLYLHDADLGIDFENVYGETLSGEKVYPVQIDEEQELIVFDFPSESTNIYIPDNRNNVLQIVLTT